ncbi:MAG: phosphate acyltransferase [Candidatus Kapaibacterium sp.]
MNSSDFVQHLQERARMRNARVAFPDATDPRTLQAASILVSERIATPVLVGDEQTVSNVAMAHGISLQGVEFINPPEFGQRDEVLHAFMNVRPGKIRTLDDARARCAVPTIAAGMALHIGAVDAVVAGSVTSTADVLRAALATIPLASGVSTLSSFFFMILNSQVLIYTDCAVVPEPDALQLCHIAGSAAQNMLRVAELQPRVAFLSFSTKGSAESASVLRVRQAAELFRQQFPNIPADGELQADAALVASVAERKSPASPLHGDANVLVFPNLDAGNIGYKLTERLAGAVALGPIVQGLSKPYCDLSRGCSADDIVNVACVAVLMSSLTA